MTHIIDDYLEEVRSNLRARTEDRDAIINELRTHLRDQVADRQAQDPEAAKETIERAVINDFGNPQDLALAYEPDGPVLRAPSGEVLLRVGREVGRVGRDVGRVVGRGTGKLLKVLGIALGVMLVLAIVTSVWAFYEVRPYVEDVVERNAPIDVYHYSEDCDPTPCRNETVQESFYVHEHARLVDWDLIVRGAGGGSVTVTVLDPTGNVSYQRAFSGELDRRGRADTTFAPMTGTWTVRYDYNGFQGDLWADADVYGFPDGTFGSR